MPAYGLNMPPPAPLHPMPLHPMPRPRTMTPLQLDSAEELIVMLHGLAGGIRSAMEAGDGRSAAEALARGRDLLDRLARLGRDIGVPDPGAVLEQLELCTTEDADDMPAELPAMPESSGLNVWSLVGAVGGKKLWARIAPEPVTRRTP